MREGRKEEGGGREGEGGRGSMRKDEIINFFITNRLSKMMGSPRCKLNLSASKRKNKYILPLSKPSFIADSTPFSGLVAEIDRSCNSIIRGGLSLRSLISQRSNL